MNTTPEYHEAKWRWQRRAAVTGAAMPSEAKLAPWERVLEKLEGAYSPHTLKGYRADCEHFSRWCSRRGLPSFPATPAVLCEYVVALAKHMKIGTIRRHIITIRRVHQLLCVVDPTMELDVVLTVRRVARSKIARPKQALGLTLSLRDRLIATCEDDICGTRDRALLMVGFETLCRGSELVSLQAEMLRPNLIGGHSILVERGKTDQTGYGRTVALSARGTSALRKWLDVADIDRGPIFRPVYQGQVVSRRLEMRSVTRILKKRAALAGLLDDEVRNISSHSLRIGGAQQLTINGQGLAQVMRAGGWRSITTVSRYIENAEMSLWD